MPEIGGVHYSDEAFEHMRQLHERIEAGEIPRHEGENEAAVIHAFHREFPGLIWHGEPLPAPGAARAGRFYGNAPTATERASGEQKEAEDEGPLRPGTAAHKVLVIYGDGARRTAYDASHECSGDWHSKRRESTRLLDRRFLRKAGTLPNRSPAGRDHVDAYVITYAGRVELARLQSEGPE